MLEKIILEETRAISLDHPVVFVIPDNVEGDMTFTIKLVNNKEDGADSYTRYNAIDAYNAEIIISNAPKNKSLTIGNDIFLGTYKKKYKLFLKYSLTEILENEFRNISVRFISKEQ